MKFGVKCPISKDMELLVDLSEKKLDIKVLDCSFFIYLYGVVDAQDWDSAKKRFVEMTKNVGAQVLQPLEGRFGWIIFPVDDTEPEGLRGASDLDTENLE